MGETLSSIPSTKKQKREEGRKKKRPGLLSHCSQQFSFFPSAHKWNIITTALYLAEMVNNGEQDGSKVILVNLKKVGFLGPIQINKNSIDHQDTTRLVKINNTSPFSHRSNFR